MVEEKLNIQSEYREIAHELLERAVNNALEFSSMEKDDSSREKIMIELMIDEWYCMATDENDDISLGLLRDSRLVYQATSTGTHFIEVDSYLSSYTGDYRLQVAATTPPPPASP